MAVNVRDVAERAGVSVGTVSNVLNSPAKVAPATTERVLAAIDALGFVRNDAARQLRAGSSRSLGLLVLDLGNPFFTDVARGVEDRAQRSGLSVLLANTDQDARRESGYLDLFDEQRVRGVLITPVGEVGDRLDRLRAHGIPVVLVDRLAEDPQLSSVSVDDVGGGRLAALHLIRTGRRRLVFVGGPAHLRQVRDRLAGVREALATAPGVALEVISTPSLTIADGVSAGRRILEASNRPDGVVAANDLVALGVLQGVAITGGWRVPHDLAIVGYDDIEFAAAASVPITSIRQPRRRMGVEAVDLMLAELDGRAMRRQIVFQPDLIVRESTGVRA